jgi:nitrite reductase (NADH) large subunit
MARLGLESIQDKVTDPDQRKALYDRFVFSQRFARLDPWAERVAGRHTEEFTPMSRRMEFVPA